MYFIESKRIGQTVFKLKKDIELGEFSIQVSTNGIRNKERDYFTDCIKDAKETFQAMMKEEQKGKRTIEKAFNRNQESIVSLGKERIEKQGRIVSIIEETLTDNSKVYNLLITDMENRHIHLGVDSFENAERIFNAIENNCD